MDGTVINVIQLATLAAIIDGEATSAEIDIIGTEVGQAFNVSAEEVKTHAERLINSHKNNNVASRPVWAVRRGLLAMRKLSQEDRDLAINIANEVTADAGVETSEQDFLEGLTYFMKHPIRWEEVPS